MAEARTGIPWVGAPSACSGRKRWGEKYPEAAAALRELAAAQAPQDPPCRTTLAYTRLTAQAAGEAWRAPGSSETQVPCASPRAAVVNRLGYRWRQVLKAQPQKKRPETEAIFAHRPKRSGEPSRPRGQPVEQGR